MATVPWPFLGGLSSTLGGLTSFGLAGLLTSLTITLRGPPLPSELFVSSLVTSLIVTLGGLISLMTDLRGFTSIVTRLGSSTSMATIALNWKKSLRVLQVLQMSQVTLYIHSLIPQQHFCSYPDVSKYSKLETNCLISPLAPFRSLPSSAASSFRLPSSQSSVCKSRSLLKSCLRSETGHRLVGFELWPQELQEHRLWNCCSVCWRGLPPGSRSSRGRIARTELGGPKPPQR